MLVITYGPCDVGYFQVRGIPPGLTYNNIVRVIMNFTSSSITTTLLVCYVNRSMFCRARLKFTKTNLISVYYRVQ